MTQEDAMVSYLEVQYTEMFGRTVGINDNWDLYPEEWWDLDPQTKLNILKEALANKITIANTEAFSQALGNSR